MLKTLTEQQAKALQEAIKEIVDTPDYGSVKIQIRDGKPTLLTLERTVKLD